MLRSCEYNNRYGCSGHDDNGKDFLESENSKFLWSYEGLKLWNVPYDSKSKLTWKKCVDIDENNNRFGCSGHDDNGTVDLESENFKFLWSYESLKLWNVPYDSKSNLTWDICWCCRRNDRFGYRKYENNDKVCKKIGEFQIGAKIRGHRGSKESIKWQEDQSEKI